MILYPKIPIWLLIVIAAVAFIGAFLVAPFFFGRCFVVKKFQMASKEEVNGLLEHNKSLSKIEVDGNKVILTRAGDVKTATFEISAKGSKKFRMNKKVTAVFSEEESVTVEFSSEVSELYVTEIEGKGKNGIFLSNFYSSLIMAGIQCIAVAGVVALTVFAYSGFNDGLKGHFSRMKSMYYPNYNFAYLSCAVGLLVGIISFVFNMKSMQRSQKPLNINFNFFKKGGRK